MKYRASSLLRCPQLYVTLWKHPDSEIIDIPGIQNSNHDKKLNRNSI